MAQTKTELTIDKPLSVIKTEFEKTLLEIRTFAQQKNLKSWAGILNKVPLKLPDTFMIILIRFWSSQMQFHQKHWLYFKAANQAWVFGGMGSWNDIGYKGQADYHKVSKNLLNILHEVITAAASSTLGI